MRIHQYIILTTVCSVFILFACSFPSQIATVAEAPQSTIKLVSTTLLSTSTREVSSTPTITPTLKHSTPVSNYKDITVISGAFHGWEAGSGWYVFYINLPMDEVEKFYREELESNGWTIYQHATDVSNGYGAHGTSLHFKKTERQ